MRSRKLISTAIVVAAVLYQPGPAVARPIAAFVRTVPTGTRSIGMAMTGVADASDPANIFLNPANAAFARGMSIIGGFDNWEPNVNHFDFGVAGGRTWAQTSSMAIGAAITHTRADLRVRDPNTNLQVQTQASYMTTSAGANWAGEGVSVAFGGAAKWSTDDDDGPVAFDLGVNIGTDTDVKSARLYFSVAASARNMGTDDEAAVFTTMNAGAQYHAGASLRVAGMNSPEQRQHSATLNIDTFDDTVAGGVEVVGWNILSLRYGYGDRAIVGMSAHTLGGGLTGRAGLFTIRIDYAYLSASDANAQLNSFGTTMSFDW